MESPHRILLKTIMTKKPYTININEPFSDAWDMFKTYDIRHLPVVDDDGILKGIVTQRDLYRIQSPRVALEGELLYDRATLDSHILKTVMVKEVFTLLPDDTLGAAIQAMARERYGCIPVVDEHKYLVGIVTQANIFKAIAEYFV